LCFFSELTAAPVTDLRVQLYKKRQQQQQQRPSGKPNEQKDYADDEDKDSLENARVTSSDEEGQDNIRGGRNKTRVNLTSGQSNRVVQKSARSRSPIQKTRSPVAVAAAGKRTLIISRDIGTGKSTIRFVKHFV
jgi:HrpA-like RNA helicase